MILCSSFIPLSLNTLSRRECGEGAKVWPPGSAYNTLYAVDTSYLHVDLVLDMMPSTGPTKKIKLHIERSYNIYTLVIQRLS